MTDHRKRKGSSVKDLVTVAFAEDIDLAKHYRKLLSEEGIPAAIRHHTDDSNFESIAILVPEEMLDEAHILIESQNAYEDFYEQAFRDPDEEYQEDDYEEEY